MLSDAQVRATDLPHRGCGAHRILVPDIGERLALRRERARESARIGRGIATSLGLTSPSYACAADRLLNGCGPRQSRWAAVEHGVRDRGAPAPLSESSPFLPRSLGSL